MGDNRQTSILEDLKGVRADKVDEGDVSAMVGPDVVNFLGDELGIALKSVIKEIADSLKLKMGSSDISQLVDKFKHYKSTDIDNMASVITTFLEKEITDYKKSGRVSM